jgi:hypothetical protein
MGTYCIIVNTVYILQLQEVRIAYLVVKMQRVAAQQVDLLLSVEPSVEHLHLPHSL